MCSVSKTLPIGCSLPQQVTITVHSVREQGDDAVGSLCVPGHGHGGLNQLDVLACHLIPVLVLGTLQVKISSVWPCSQF